MGDVNDQEGSARPFTPGRLAELRDAAADRAEKILRNENANPVDTASAAERLIGCALNLDRQIQGALSQDAEVETTSTLTRRTRRILGSGSAPAE